MGIAFAHQDQCCGTVGNGAGVGRRYATILLKRRTQLANFIHFGVAGLLIDADNVLAAAGLDADRCDLRLKITRTDGALGAGQGFNREVVHRLAGNVKGVGTLLGEATHQATFVGIF